MINLLLTRPEKNLPDGFLAFSVYTDPKGIIRADNTSIAHHLIKGYTVVGLRLGVVQAVNLIKDFKCQKHLSDGTSVWIIPSTWIEGEWYFDPNGEVCSQFHRAEKATEFVQRIHNSMFEYWEERL